MRDILLPESEYREAMGLTRPRAGVTLGHHLMVLNVVHDPRGPTFQPQVGRWVLASDVVRALRQEAQKNGLPLLDSIADGVCEVAGLDPLRPGD